MSQKSLLKLLNVVLKSNISQLENDQMRQMLLKLQQEGQAMVTPTQDSTPNKTKTIRKFRNKATFKRFISKRMPAIVERSLNLVAPDLCAPKKSQNLNTVKPKGGKSKFKKGKNKVIEIKRSRFRNNLKQVLSKAMPEELSCPICLETMISPALTLCAHVYCLQCIDESLLFSPNCPTCRQSIKFTEPIICGVLDRLIRVKVQLNQAEVPRYKERLAKFEAWRKSRFLDYESVTVGTLIDVRDTESIWCQGTVRKIYKKTNIKTGRRMTVGVLVHYNRWNKLYNEIIDVPTRRLAPLNCFSLRADIPRYNLSQDSDNMRGSVFTSQNQMAYFMNINNFGIPSGNDEIVESSSEESGAQNDENDDEQNEEIEELQSNSAIRMQFVDSEQQGSQNEDDGHRDDGHRDDGHRDEQIDRPFGHSFSFRSRVIERLRRELRYRSQDRPNIARRTQLPIAQEQDRELSQHIIDYASDYPAVDQEQQNGQSYVSLEPAIETIPVGASSQRKENRQSESEEAEKDRGQ